MPSKREHNVKGLLISEGFECLLIKIEGKDIFSKEGMCRIGSNAVGSIIGSSAPDKFEPAYSPNHRSVFHSAGALGASSYLSYKAITKTKNLHPALGSFLRGSSIGYTSHLFLDASTPKGLPLLK
jgi:hypothetical protein